MIPSPAIWVLTLWSLAVPPMEGGQYQTREQCARAGQVQVIGLRKQYGRLWWSCDLRHE